MGAARTWMCLLAGGKRLESQVQWTGKVPLGYPTEGNSARGLLAALSYTYRILIEMR